jgi:hypothetical protein
MKNLPGVIRAIARISAESKMQSASIKAAKVQGTEFTGQDHYR